MPLPLTKFAVTEFAFIFCKAPSRPTTLLATIPYKPTPFPLTKFAETLPLIFTNPWNVGLLLKITLPDPLDVVTPVPPFSTSNVPTKTILASMFPTIFAALISVNANPLAVMLVTEMSDGKRALSRVPEAMLDALTLEIPYASPVKLADTDDTEIEEGNWVFNKLP